MRRKTNSVKIGNVVLSSDTPVMIQSMLNTPTMDTQACVEQAIRVIEAGGELVRITAPGVKEAENLKNIHARLCERGYFTPISADIHFVPEAALIAARYVEKVRINPGNFVDKRATFKMLTYTDEEYIAELNILEEKFTEFLKICRQHHTAVRIGTNHGSLSDRIMSRYGDTPAGMVEATMEYLRVCKRVGFQDVVISLKSSDCRVMVDAVRLLVKEMEEEDMHFPLHLGVTEAGEGEDGRIRSAIGIGTLLNEGIGDTIRVSLTEAPEAEIPVAKALAEICKNPVYEGNGSELKGNCLKPFIVADDSGLKTGNVREMGFLVEKEQWKVGLKAPEMIYSETPGPEWSKLPAQTILLVPAGLLEKAKEYRSLVIPVYGAGEYLREENSEKDSCVRIDCMAELDDRLLGILKANEKIMLMLAVTPEYQVYRKIYKLLNFHHLQNTTFIHAEFEGKDRDMICLRAASQLGGFFLDRLAGGLWITTPGIPDLTFAMELSRNILQSAGVRRYKAEFISCPGCGRTLFDLQGAVAKVKQAFAGKNELKIAVMGCVVNGPGEMGDADYGYVGAGNGKVNLYKGRQMVKAAVPEEQAIEELKRLIGLG